jgi:hypothetical protein
MRPAPFVLALAFGCFCPQPARAALTASEQAQIKGFVAGAQVGNAARVRALVARPDLSSDESAASLTDAVAPLPWSDARAAFFRDMLFGGASAAARPAIVVASTRAMLARADAVFARFPTLDDHADALAELSRIYGFLVGEIANAGHPQGWAHDPQAGIPASSYADCAKALSDHIQRNPRVLKADAALTPSAERVRAEVQLALYDMMEDSPTRRVDAAGRLGLAGARRGFLTDLGVLVLDDGRADDTRVLKVRGLLDRLPAARAGVEAIYFGQGRPTFRSRGPVVGVEVPLETTQTQAAYAPQSDEVEPGPLDLPLFVLGYELAKVAAHSALDNRGDLRLQADQDAVAASPQASPPGASAMSTEQRLAGTMAQLITDAPRTLDLAFVRFLAGKAQTAALVSDAMGALAAFAPGGTPASGLVLPLGRPKGAGGDTEPLPATNVRLAPSGAVVAFVLDGRKWEIHRDNAGAVDAVRRDGAAITLAMLPSARLPVSSGTSWSGGGLVFARLVGSPRAGVAPGPRIRVVSGDARGVEAIATPAPGDDVSVDCDLRVVGEGGLIVRAVSVKEGFQGASVVLLPGAPVRASLRISEGVGTEREIAPAADIGPGPTYHVRVTVRGSAIEALVGSAKLTGTLPATLAHGDVALRVRRGASLDAGAFSVRAARAR